MARTAAILRALATAVRREGRSLASFTSNNLFLVGATLAAMSDPGAFAALGSLIFVILLFPLSSDPLRLVPPERLALWPLSARERHWLRLLSPLLNPMTWLVLAAALWRGVSRGFWLLLGGLFLVGFLASAIPWRGAGLHFRHMPAVGGRLRELVRLALRQMLASLDFYAALLVSLTALGFRLAGQLSPDGHFPLTMIVMLCFSTVPQCLFALDGATGLTRYRLLGLAGWQILAAKDAAYVALSLLLTAPLSPLCGLCSALVVTAVARPVAVTPRVRQPRWRFLSGDSFPISLAQVFLMAAACAAANTYGVVVLLPCLAAYVGSTWIYGRILLEPGGK